MIIIIYHIIIIMITIIAPIVIMIVVGSYFLYLDHFPCSTDDSLLKKHRPDLMHLPTTNGEHCTGDGIKMALDIGADTGKPLNS